MNVYTIEGIVVLKQTMIVGIIDICSPSADSHWEYWKPKERLWKEMWNHGN